MLRNRRVGLLLVVLMIGLASSSAHADSIQITLEWNGLTCIVPCSGGWVASLTNLTTNTIFLNGDQSSIFPSTLTIDDSPFLLFAPPTLAPGAGTGFFSLFNFVVPPGTPAGNYTGTFSILGGPSSTDFTALGTATFTIHVITVAPEPGTLVLLGTGILGIGGLLRLRRWHW